MRRHVFVLGSVCALLCSGAQASAQMPADAPFSPLVPVVSTMVTDGLFEQSPLALPFAQSGIKEVQDGNHTNFVHQLSVPYETVVAYFEDKNQRQKGFDLIDRKVYTMAPPALKLRYLGVSPNPKKGYREYQLGHDNMSRRFVIRVARKGQGSTLTFVNTVRTSMTSGQGPARVQFSVIGSDKRVPFRWN